MPNPSPQGSPLASLARHWVTAALIMLVGLVIGAGIGWVLPATYRAEERIAVVPTSTSAYALQGYPLGASSLASDYARWIRMTAATQEGTASVSASPVPDTSVIRIEAEAPSDEEARKAASDGSLQLRTAVDEATAARSPEVALESVREIQPKVAEAQAAVDAASERYNSAIGARSATSTVNALRQELTDARTALAELQLQMNARSDLYRSVYASAQGNSKLEVTSPATDLGNNRITLMARYGLMGLGLGYVIAQILVVARDRKRTRRAGATATS